MKVNLADKLSTFSDLWAPRTIARLQRLRRHGGEGP